MNEWMQWEIGKKLETAAHALERNGFAVTVCPDRDSAATRIEQEAEGAATVGFGGSVSLVELGFPGRLAAQGYECLVHSASGLSADERLAVMRRQLTCDLFLSGTNAVTLDGKLVNIDATGNRVGALTFGPKKVVAVVGVNKLAEDADAALRRIRSWAAPANAFRLKRKTPCASSGQCADCDSPDRICRIVQVLERKPPLTDLRVLLVAEPLGL
ncbi:MAG: lactate utilization protein [Deltaproteobacteria bacterium]|nr:lactate utilization protein [Deltaproteobacteria bacterium]